MLARDTELFTDLVVFLHKEQKREFPLISHNDVARFVDKVKESLKGAVLLKFDEGDGGCYEESLEFDHILDPLLKIATAHFLYHKAENLREIDINLLNPNTLRFNFIDNLVRDKEDVEMGYFQLIELSPSASTMIKDMCITQIDEMLSESYIRGVIKYYVNKMHMDADPLKRINSVINDRRKSPFKGMGYLYFALMNLFLKHIDKIFEEYIETHAINCVRDRCLNTMFIGFPTENEAIRSLRKFNYSFFFPAWGLIGKIRSASKGGRVLRPWKGKLSLSHEGKLLWSRPETLLEM